MKRKGNLGSDGKGSGEKDLTIRANTSSDEHQSQTASAGEKRIDSTGSPTDQSLSPFFFVAVFLDMMTVAMVVPLLAAFCRTLGISRSFLGMIQSIYGLMQVVSTPILGTLSDRIGRRPVLMISLLGTSFSFTVLAFGVWNLSIVGFLAARVLMGGLRQTMSVGAALVSEVYTKGLPEGEAKRKAVGRGMARFQVSTSIAFVVGPALGGYLADRFDLVAPAAVASFLGFLNALLMFFSVPPAATVPHPSSPTTARKRSNPLALVARIFKERSHLSALLLVLYLFSFSFIMTQSTLGNVMYDLAQQEGSSSSNGTTAENITFTSAGAAGRVIAVSSGLVSLSQVILPPFLKRFPSYNLALGSMLVCCCGFVIQASASTVKMFLTGIVSVSSCSGVADTINKSTFSTKFSSGVAGEVMSVVYSIDGFNRVVAPLIGGVLADWIAPTAPSMASLIACISATTFYIRHVLPNIDVLSKDQ